MLAFKKILPVFFEWWHIMLLSSMLLCLTGLWLGWTVVGGHLYMISTPSMGTTAPRGSLLIVSPFEKGQSIKTGELVVFKVPNSSSVYFHRVYRKLPNGKFETKGDLEVTSDPWTISIHDIIGVNPTVIPALGWLYKTIAWFLIGSSILIIGSFFISTLHYRHSFYLIIPTILLVVPTLIYRPLINGYVLGTQYNNSTLKVSVTNDGILPANFSVFNSGKIYIQPGDVKIIKYSNIPQNNLNKEFTIKIQAALNWWEYLIVISLCSIPILIWPMLHRKQRKKAMQT